MDLMDQAQHFGGSASSAVGSVTGDPSAEFREGLEATERESTCYLAIVQL